MSTLKTFATPALRWLLPLLLLGTCSVRGASAPSQRPAPAPGAALDGLWQGALSMPGGQLEVMFRLVRLTSGDYFATLDAPKQRVVRLAVTVVTRADTVFLLSAEVNSNFTGRLTPDGNQLRGTWQQPGFQAPLTLVRAAGPARPVSARPRLTPPYREEEVSVTNQAANLRLAGALTVPAGPGPFPAVVLLSDLGPDDRDGAVGGFGLLGQLADYLTRRGIAVLRLDDRGAGQSGGTAQATLTDQVGDVQEALNYLRTRSEIDLNHLGLVGHGEGGNLALLVATQPLPPAFVVGLAPYGLPGAEVALQQQATTLRNLQVEPTQIKAVVRRQEAMFEIIRQTPNNAQAQAIVANMLRQNNPALDPAAAQAAAAGLVSPHSRTFLDFDPSLVLPAVACPVLLLYGTDDLIMDVKSNAGALVKGLKGNKDVTLRELPGVNHLFQPNPTQWPVIAGELRPNLAPAAAEAVRTWLMTQTEPEGK